MRSIKFTEAELEFLVGQYELELTEAEKYIGEIKNILKKLGVISKDISVKNEISKKRKRGRPAKAVISETKPAPVEKSPKTKIKKKGKPGRPKKSVPKKGSVRSVKPAAKPLESKTTVARAAEAKPTEKKAVKKVKQAKPPAKSRKKKVAKPVPAPKKPPETETNQAVKKAAPAVVPEVKPTEI